MGVEIERKFLVDHEKWRQVPRRPGKHYHQGYLTDDENCTVRVRVAGKTGFITIKGRSKGISRAEYEYKIPAKEAAELIAGLARSSVEKTRFRVKFAGKIWEIDEFAGENEGLIMAEIELKDENDPFEKPDWITAEVSDDDRYYNSNLSKNPFKNWGSPL